MISRRLLLTGLGAGLVGAGCTSSPGLAAPGVTTPTVTTASPPATTPAPEAPLRFVVASDGHLGDPKASGDPYGRFVDAANKLGLDFVVVNGDLAQGGVAAQQQVRAHLEKLTVPFFVTPGNHDELSESQWQQTWGTAPDLVQRFGRRSIVLANTSNASGEYLCPNQDWLTNALAGESAQDDVLVFCHITPKDWTKFGVDCPSTRTLFAQTANLRAVFNGHDHDQDGLKRDQDVPYLFDGHLGGHWGTPQPGFRLSVLDGRSLRTRMVDLDGRRHKELVLTW